MISDRRPMERTHGLVVERSAPRATKGPQEPPLSSLSQPLAAARARTKVREARKLVLAHDHPAKDELFDLLLDAEECLNRSLGGTEQKIKLTSRDR